MDDGVPSYIVWLFPVDAQGDFMAVFLLYSGDKITLWVVLAYFFFFFSND